ATVLLDWDARLATVSRRQGRRDRHYDWAHWYPRIAVFDRGGWQHHALYPQGEFYGEFARYDVTLEVAEDQVIGATGVPVEGDPGWSRATDAPVPEAQFRRDAYPATPATRLGLLVDRPAAGRKRIRWRADDVHHFAWAADPDFTYDSAQYTRAGADPVAIHLLAQPGDSAWNRPVALRRTVDALRWLERLFGPYPYPQLTNLHRLDTGGTEFPMMIMDYTDSEGLIVHEVTHQWLHGILANNEWRDGWLDEGFTSFVTNWYWEEHGQPDVWDRTIEAVAARERAGRTEPIATPGPGFSDFPTYSAMTYSKASLVFRMLRDLLGEDAFRRGLRLYSERHRFQHVDEADLRSAMEEAGGQDLGWFFRQWLHTTDTLDYGIGDLRVERAPGGWRTEVEVLRLGKAWMPVTLQVGDATRRLAGREQRQVVSVTTRTRPSEAVLDPRGVLLDLDPTNQRKAIP
ncbi:MAG: M1 family metallopeptidase, partial [Gemmatimonadota bacterium]|nr:M1 family metallopeptidase [Gemmatimonadota bacterium]